MNPRVTPIALLLLTACSPSNSNRETLALAPESPAPVSTAPESPAPVSTAPPSSVDQLHEAYDALRQSLASRPDALAKLDLAQRAWQAYCDAHERERFPAEEPQYAYGTVYAACVALEREGETRDRAQELQRPDPCQATLTAAKVQAAADKAEAALDADYGKVRSAYAADPVFLAAFEHAQLAWLKFRDAQMAFRAASNPGSSTCSTHAKEEMTRARTATIQRWLAPPEEYDACSGSLGGPRQ